MRLVWDEEGKKQFETGVSDVALFVKDSTGAYGKGVAWSGVSSIQESPSGAEETALYADNIKYASLRSREDLGYTIEAYQFPEEFEVCDGTAQIIKGVRLGQQKRSAFGIAYKTVVGNDADSEAGYKLHIYYNGIASPSEKSHETINDSPDAITFSWEVTTTPVTVNGYTSASSIELDSTKVQESVMKSIEDKIYGTAESEPELPSLDEIINIVKAAG